MVGAGGVDPCGAHLAELPAVAGDGVGEVDDVEDPGAPDPVVMTARMPVGLGPGVGEDPGGAWPRRAGDGGGATHVSTSSSG